MKTAIIIAIIVIFLFVGICFGEYGVIDLGYGNKCLYGDTPDGEIFGCRIASTVIAIQANGLCVKFEGEEKECTFDDRAFIVSFKKLYR